MAKRERFFLAALAACVSSSHPAQAQDWTSHYTDTSFDRCTRLDRQNYGAEFACPGYRGYPLWIAEGDLRFYVSYGFNARNEKAATQTLPAFNSIGQKIEWLVDVDAQGNETPVASILRYYVSRSEAGNPDTQILVVTKISESNTCHVAYVDAGAEINANTIARQAAAELVPAWDCKTMTARTFGTTSIDDR